VNRSLSLGSVSWWWNVPSGLVLLLAFRPVTRASVAAAEVAAYPSAIRQVAVREAADITWKVTWCASALRLYAAVSVPRGGVRAQCRPLSKHGQALQNAVPTNGSKSESGATEPAKMGPVAAAEALVWREVSFVDLNRGKGDATHVRFRGLTFEVRRADGEVARRPEG